MHSLLANNKNIHNKTSINMQVETKFLFCDDKFRNHCSDNRSKLLMHNSPVPAYYSANKLISPGKYLERLLMYH